MMGGFFKGTSIDQDSRFSDKEKKLMKEIDFPEIFKKKVNMKKVKIDPIRKWATKRAFELGIEDDILPDYICEMLENEQKPDPKRMQINITGFLADKAPQFMEELWELLLSAQDSYGVPKQFLEETRKEAEQKRMENERIQEVLKERARKAAADKGHSGWDVGPNQQEQREVEKHDSYRQSSRSPPPQHRHHHGRHRHHRHRRHESRSPSPSSLRHRSSSRRHHHRRHSRKRHRRSNSRSRSHSPSHSRLKRRHSRSHRHRHHRHHHDHDYDDHDSLSRHRRHRHHHRHRHDRDRDEENNGDSLKRARNAESSSPEPKKRRRLSDSPKYNDNLSTTEISDEQKLRQEALASMKNDE